MNENLKNLGLCLRLKMLWMLTFFNPDCSSGKIKRSIAWDEKICQQRGMTIVVKKFLQSSLMMAIFGLILTSLTPENAGDDLRKTVSDNTPGADSYGFDNNPPPASSPVVNPKGNSD